MEPSPHGAFCRGAERQRGTDSPMSTERVLYAVFLYGANIPGGRTVTRESVESAVEHLRPAVTFGSIVGRPDSILLWCSGSSTEDSVRRTVSETLDCPCVAISVATVERLVDSALDSIRQLGYPTLPPYRVTLDSAEWECCLVLCSESLPPNTEGPMWLFSPTRNAVTLKVLERRALLTRKRRYTANRKRVMLGATLIEPWERLLEERGVAVTCLTSRTVNRVSEVATAANTLRAHGPRI